MDLELNLDYIVENPDHTKKLAIALDTTNLSVKKQVFEILGALCAYNSEGYKRTLEVLDHYKQNKGERYRFKIVVEELRTGKDIEYLCIVAAFLNVSIISAKSLRERIRIRNEYLGLKILDIISRLRTTISDNSECDLLVQFDIFEEQRLADECQLTGPSGVDLSSPQDVFYTILRQVAHSPQEFPFLNILQHLLRVDCSHSISDVIWDTAEKLVHRATLCETKEDAEKLLCTPSYHHSLNKLLRGIQESGGRCQCSCHSHGEVSCGGADGRIRKRTPLQFSFSTSESIRSPRILSPANSASAFSPELLASLSRAISPPPKAPQVTLGKSLSEVPPQPSVPPGNVIPPPPPPLPGPLGVPPPPPSLSLIKTSPFEEERKLPQQSTPKPKNKMKTLNWTKIPSNKVLGKNNLWSLLAKSHHGNPYTLDFEAIEGLFCQQNGQASTRLMAKNGRDSFERKKRESSEINLLDGKRSLNVNIFLKQFRSSNDEIIAIMRCGAHGEIGAEKLRGLLKILPESDEIELLRGYSGERMRLGNAEKFLLELIELPHYKLRCEGMLLKEEFPSNVAYLEPAIESIRSAAEELKHCPNLHGVLYMLLVAGNFLNSGGYAGDAAGFKMMSLLKVTEIRANKPGMNLIHYVVQEAENKFPHLLKFPELLPSLEDAAKLSIDNLKSEITNLRNKVNKISQQVSAAGEDIKEQMEEFLKFAANEIGAIQKEVENLEKIRLDMADFLCEDIQTFKLEECFKIFQSFCQKFKAAIEENEKRRQNEKKAAERRKQREEQALKKKNSGDNRPSSFSGSESDNIIDMFLGDARGGFNRFYDNGSFKSRSSKSKKVSSDGIVIPSELHRMNSLTSSVPSEEDPTASPRIVRRRIESSNSIANGDIEGTDTQSPNITPNGTLRKRRSRLSSEDREDNLMDYLRSTAEADATRDKTKSETGSLDRSWFRRSSRRRRPEMLSVDLNDRERAASPGPSPLLDRKVAATLETPDTSRNRQWRLKIEEWLQENEKEQEREKKLKDKIALRRQEVEQRENDVISLTDGTHNEVKTDSEIYANKIKSYNKNSISGKCSELQEVMPLKDKSKWRKSNLNVANSSESIYDERRRSKSRKTVSDPEIDDTISFYIRSNDLEKAENSNLPKRNDMSVICGEPVKNLAQSDTNFNFNIINASQSKPFENIPNSENKITLTNENQSQHDDPGMFIDRSRFYQSMREPSFNKLEKINKSAASDDELLDKKDKNSENRRNKLKYTAEDDMKNTSSDKEDEGNFERFSYMRKTTRRSKPRKAMPSEAESRKSDEKINDNNRSTGCVDNDKFQDLSTSNILEPPQKNDLKFMEDALKDINESSKEIQNLSENLYSKYNDNLKMQENGDQQKKKEKLSTTLKAKLSKKLLSLTENLKVSTKPTELQNSKKIMAEVEDEKITSITDSPSSKIEKVLLETMESFKEQQSNPIKNHSEMIASKPRQHLLDAPVKNKQLQTSGTSNSTILAEPELIKESYVSDTNNMKIAHAIPVSHDIKPLASLPLQKVKDECEKDEGFEETQSQLSSQGAGSSYDTDLADSPKSIRQTKDADTSKFAEEAALANNNDNYNLINKMPALVSKTTNSKGRMSTKFPLPDSPLERSQSVRYSDAKVSNKNAEHLVRSSVRGSLRSPSVRRSKQNEAIKSSMPKVSTLNLSEVGKTPLRLTGKEGLESNIRRSKSEKRSIRRPSLRGLTETSPKIGRRVAAYTKAIKSMTNNLRGSKKLETYDVTQSMPPTPSEEKKTLVSGLNLIENGKKARSSSSVCNQSRQSTERSINSTVGTKGSVKSLSSDKSLNLSRKSSETSVVTVKSAKKSPVLAVRYPKTFSPARNLLLTGAKTKPNNIRSKSPVQTKQTRVPKTVKDFATSHSETKLRVRPNLTVRKASSDKSCGFMKATSASSAKTCSIKMNSEQNKLKPQNGQKMASKPILVSKG